MFVIENVDRFRASSEFQFLLDEAAHGMIADYELSHGLLMAADFGVPQRRTRTIVIGSRIGRIDLPDGRYSKHPTLDDRKPWRTVRDAIGTPPNARTPPNRRNSEVWDRETRRGSGSLAITHSIPALTQRENINSQTHGARLATRTR